MTRVAARVSPDAVQHPVLVIRAMAENPIAWVVLSASLSAALVSQRTRLFAGWAVFEQGAVLRGLTAVPLAMSAWLSSLYHYNFLAGQWHVADRLLVIALGVAALGRPVFLIPFAIAARIVAGQFVMPFGTVAGPNIDALLVTVLVGVAALHVLYVLTGIGRSAAIVLFVATVLASHFFVPGSGKLALGWLGVDRIWHFPLSAYTAGWLGHTSGAWARAAAQLAEPYNLPLQLSTLVVELGSVIAVVHHRLLRWWLLLAVAFHVIVFATTGFWFLAWLAMEVTLLAVVSARRLHPWVAQNATPARGLLAAVVVIVAGARLYQPPTLSWFDGPVAYGYELEGVGASGASYHVPIAVAAPFEQELNFLRLRLVVNREASDAYGAVGTRADFDALNAIDSWEALLAHERRLPLSDPRDVAASERFVAKLLEHINRDGRAPRFIRPLPTHFWSSRPPPVYAYQEPLSRLEVVRVTGLHRPGGQAFRRESVLTVEADRDGSSRITARTIRPATTGDGRVP